MCQHLNRIGDNYGEACVDCGATMRGYGYYAQDRQAASCQHDWTSAGDDYEVCVYCEATRRVTQ